jgi:hypothetical protein
MGLKIACIGACLWFTSSQAVDAQLPDCIDTLYDIYQTEVNVTDDSEVRTYILCPDTLFKIADSFGEARKPRNGRQSPLHLGRSNIQIICGEDGKSENNCVFEGGNFQVHLYDYFKTQSPIVNTLVKGITFTKVTTFSVLAENEGHLVIRDCVFKVCSSISRFRPARLFIFTHPQGLALSMLKKNNALSLIFAQVLQGNVIDQSLRHLELDSSYQSKPPTRRTPLHVVVSGCIFLVSTVNGDEFLYSNAIVGLLAY